MAFDTAEDRGFLARYRWYFLAAAGAAAVAWMGYRAWRPIPVGVVEARQGPAERVLAITGRTRPQVTVTIVPKVGGQIVRLAKEEGQAVRAGELLVQLDADAPRAAVEEAQSKIAAQERAVQEAGRNHDRVAQLRERGLATVKEFEQARFDLDQARAELQRLQASRREVSAKLADATIVAPVSGVVLARPVDPGQVVAAQTVIYEIAPLADVEVEADVDEQFLAEVHEGLQADVLVAGRAEPVAATLYYVSPKVDPRTGGAKVRLRFDARNKRLQGGEFGLTMADGSTRKLAVRVLDETGFHLGAGLYHGFDGKYHGQWRGPLVVEGEHFADCSSPEATARLNQFRDCLIEVCDSATGAIGIGNCQTWVQGRWPELGLPDG